MYQSSYDTNNGHGDMSGQRSFMGPFLMGVAVGIGCAAFYAMGRNKVFGEAVADRIHGFEDRAVSMKDTVVERASHVKDTVVDKVSHVKDAVANRFQKSDSEVSSAIKEVVDGASRRQSGQSRTS